MQRRLYEEHVRWTQDARRKPLVLEGARGTCKTWLLNNPRLKARGFLTRCRLSRNRRSF